MLWGEYSIGYDDISGNVEQKCKIALLTCLFVFSGEQHQRPLAGILVDSQTVPFIPLDIQEMVLDEDEREQNEDIFDRMVDDMAQLYQESQVNANSDRRRWSV